MKRSVRWQSVALASLGVALLLPSAVASWFGRDVSVLVIVSASMIVIGLVADVVPATWLDRVENVKVTAGTSSVQLSLRDLTTAATQLDEAQDALKDAKRDDKAALDSVFASALAAISNVARGISSLTAESTLPSFATRYLSSLSDPYEVRGSLNDRTELTHREGNLLVATVEGTVAQIALAEGYKLHVVVTGPEGFREDRTFDLEGNPPDNWFSTSWSMVDAPDGRYVAAWALQNRWGEEVSIRTDLFSLPTEVPYTAGAETARI